MNDAGALEHAAEHLGLLDRDGAKQHGLAARVRFLDLLHHRVVFVAAGLENRVVPVDPDAGLVRRDDSDGQLVDLVELRRLGLGGAGHAREFFIHAEIILDRDRRVGARLALDGDAFLGLDGLVQTVRPAAARHDAAGVLVDDDDLAVLDDVFHIALVERIGAEQLREGVDVLGHDLIALLGGALQLLLLLGRLVGALFDLDKLGREVGQHEGIGVVGAELDPARLGQVGLMVFLVDDEEELFLVPVKFLLVKVAVHLDVRFVEELAPLRVFLDVQQLLVLRHAELHLQHLHRGGVLVVGGGILLLEELDRLLRKLVDEPELRADELLDAGLQPHERLFALDRGRARNDQRRARLVDEDGIDFVDDAVEIVALHLVVLARRHAVVAEVVEAELARGAVGDVALIHLAAHLGVHLLLDAADGDAEKIVEVPHPLGVAAGEVVVDGDELGIFPGQRVQVERQRGDEGLALARGHLGDAALVQRDAADQLDVEVHHVPRQLVVADDDLAADHAAGGILHRRESLGQDLVERLAGLEARAELVGLGAELLVGQRLVGELELVDAHDDRATLLDVFAMVAAGEFLEEET